MLDFSRQCGARLHQSQRSDPAPGNLPQLQEIDHLMEKSRRQLDCYAKMREFIIAQQTAYFQQAQEQQSKAQEGIKRDSVHQNEEAKIGGFAGAEAKKRRGVSSYRFHRVTELQLTYYPARCSSWQMSQL